MAKKKIIITGATSAIMNTVIDFIQPQKEYQIIGITSKIKKGNRKDIEWVECDLTMSNNNYSFINGAEMLIHAAAISNAYTLQDYLNTNFQSTKKLVDLANHFRVNKFVYISSVISSKTSGHYGLSKMVSEEYLKFNFKTWLILRPSVLYGYSEKAPIDSLIKKVATKNLIPCPIGDPDNLIPLYFLDAARLIYSAIFTEKICNTTKLLLGPEAFNYRSLVVEISRSLHKKVFIIPVPRIIMMGLKNLIRLFRIKVGIYPDQIVRLYNSIINFKSTDNKKLKYLSEYIRKQTAY